MNVSRCFGRPPRGLRWASRSDGRTLAALFGGQACGPGGGGGCARRPWPGGWSAALAPGSALVPLLLAALLGVGAGAAAAQAPGAHSGEGGAGAAAPAPPSGTIVYRFPVTQPMVEVSLTHAQGSGTLSLHLTGGDNVSLAVQDGDRVPSTPVVITPRGARVDNAAGGPANYRLSVPSSVGSVRVRVGGRVVRTVSAASLRAGPRSVVVALP